jgi:hypothetical protein
MRRCAAGPRCSPRGRRPQVAPVASGTDPWRANGAWLLALRLPRFSVRPLLVQGSCRKAPRRATSEGARALALVCFERGWFLPLEHRDEAEAAMRRSLERSAPTLAGSVLDGHGARRRGRPSHRSASRSGSVRVLGRSSRSGNPARPSCRQGTARLGGFAVRPAVSAATSRRSTPPRPRATAP